jgi:carboxyl-terminal processing protease
MKLRRRVIMYGWILLGTAAMLTAWANPIPSCLRGQDRAKSSGRNESELQRRYQDGSWAECVRTMTEEQSRQFLREIILLIQKNYYRQLDCGQLVPGALSQMQSAVKDETIQRQYHSDASASEKLIRYLESLQSLEIGDKTGGDGLLKPLFELSDSIGDLSREAGYGACWSDMELAASLAASLDRFSYVLTPAQAGRLYQQIDGRYRGIGIDLTYVGSYPTVFDVVQGSPAEYAGILPGDILRAVCKKNLQNLSSERIGGLLSENTSAPVELTLMRNDQEYSLTVRPVMIDAPSVRHAHLVSQSNGVGYLRISSFDRDTAWEMRGELMKLTHDGMKSLIIDVRDNGGGIFRSAVEAARLFIRDGAMIETESARSVKHYGAGGYDQGYFALPTAVLVNGNTASAAEIFAGCLQHHHRAAIIGQNTFGKQFVQSIYPAGSNQLAICVTTSKWSLSGKSGDEFHGIIPDIIASPPASNRDDFSITHELSSDNDTLRLGIDKLKSSS